MGNTIQVEQIIYQPDHLAQLSLDGFMCARENLAVAVCALRHCKHVAHRGERIPELVSECRQKLVLAPVNLREVRCQSSQVVFQSLSLRDILADSRKSNGLIIAVSDVLTVTAPPLSFEMLDLWPALKLATI